MPVDFQLAGQRKGHAIVEAAEILDFLLGPRFLPGKLVARQAQDAEALGLELLIEVFQRRVLRGQAAFGGDVDHQYDLALERRQR
ncbi:hypothetical protein D3C85_1511360 [compost metagenome]